MNEIGEVYGRVSASIDDQDVLLCPSCGSEYTHAEDHASYSGQSHVIRFYCELCPYKFELHIRQRKGNTFVFTNPAGLNMETLNGRPSLEYQKATANRKAQ